MNYFETATQAEIIHSKTLPRRAPKKATDKKKHKHPSISDRENKFETVVKDSKKMKTQVNKDRKGDRQNRKELQELEMEAIKDEKKSKSHSGFKEANISEGNTNRDLSEIKPKSYEVKPNVPVGFIDLEVLKLDEPEEIHKMIEETVQRFGNYLEDSLYKDMMYSARFTQSYQDASLEQRKLVAKAMGKAVRMIIGKMQQ